MKKQRWIAVILALVMMVNMIPYGSITEVEAAVTASIPNANMDSTTGWLTRYINSWSQESDVASADGGIQSNKVSAETISGTTNYAAKVTKVCKGDVRLKSAATMLADGKNYYRIGGKVKTSNASEKTNIHLQVRYEYMDASGNITSARNITIATLYGGSEEGYTELSGYFRGDQKADIVYLIFCMSDQQDGIFETSNQTLMYVDDTFIEAANEPAVNTEFDTIAGIQEEYRPVYGYASSGDEFSFEVTTNEAYSGNSSLHVHKDSYSTESYITSGGRLTDLAKEGILCTDEMSYTWGMYVKSKNSNAFVRMDIDVYNSQNELLGTVKGKETMLSRSEKEEVWKRIVTTAKLPDGIDAGTYMVYRIVVTSGTAEMYIDNLFGKITETYYEKMVDWSEFQNVAEWEGSTVSDGVGSVSAGTMSRKVDTLIPGATYEMAGRYSASTDATVTIEFYDIHEKKITHTQGISSKSSAGTEKETMCSFLVPEGTVYTMIFYGGTGNYTLSEYVLYEIKGHASDNSWQGEWIWYPENVLTDGQNATRYFKKIFNMSSLSTVENAFLQIAADDALTSIHVNGNLVTTHHSDSTYGNSPYKDYGKRAVNVYDIANLLQEGDNVLELVVANQSGYGGVLFEIEIYHQDGSEPVRYVSDETTDSSKDNSTWKASRRLGSPAYGLISDVTYWRRVVDNDTSILAINHGFYDETLSGVAGDTIKKVSTSVQCLTDAEKLAYDGHTFTGRLYSQEDNLYYAVVPVTMHVGAQNTVAEFDISIPDYVPAGAYQLRMDGDEIRLLWNASNQLCHIQVTAKGNTVLTKAKVTEAGKLTVDGNPVSPVFYLRPNMSGLYNYDKMSAFQSSGVELYATYNGYLNGFDYAYKIYEYENDGDSSTNPMDYLLWQGNDANGNPILNYKWFDYEILRTLDLNTNENTKVLVNVCVDAPDWWAEAHLDTDCVKYMDASGNTQLLITRKDEAALSAYQVSMASKIYQADVQKVIQKLVEHMMEASYAERVIGVRFIAGRTYEWMQYGVGPGQLVDYSTATLEAFREWLTEKYNTNAALQSAWNDSSITLEGATIPTTTERNPKIKTALLNSRAHQKVIDYHTFLGEVGANYLVACATAAKRVNPDWLVGAYNGYSWNFTSSEGIGSAHTASSIVLESDSVDFIASPISYGERVEGYATGHMALSDSVSAAGKLYMLELDNRTLHAQIESGSQTSLGKENTVSGTVRQLTRDMSINFVRGTGMWFYDMNGGWFEDDSVEARIAIMKEEFDKQFDCSSNNEVAVFVAEDNYNHVVDDIVGNDTERTTYLLTSLYEEQRREFSAMGASYDIFSVNDVLDGKLKQNYKLNIVLSPFELTDAECTTLKNALAKNGQVVLWVYMPGISNGKENAAANVERLVDMKIAFYDETHALQAETVEAEGTISLKNGIKYGNGNAKTGPWAEIKEGIPLAVYTSGETAAAYVQKENYTSVYSAVPDVPAELLRALCRKAGVHLYSDDMSDVIETNSSYIAVHSMTGGEKNIALKNARIIDKVYDVLEKREVDYSSGQLTFTMSAGDTRLFRVEVDSMKGNVCGEMTWTDTLDNPDNPNLFANGTFDKYDGSVDKSAWAVGELDASQVIHEYDQEYLLNFDEKAEKMGLEDKDMIDWALEGNHSILGFVTEDNNMVLKVEKPKDYKYIRYYGYSFMPNETYKVSFRAKADTNGLVVNGVNGNWNNEESFTLTTDWKVCENIFSVQKQMQDYYMKFMASSSTGTIYMDDFKIEKINPDKFYYSEGYGTFGREDCALMVETIGDFWNYGTSVEEGITYRYSMDMKVEGADKDFQFIPYLYDYVNSKRIPLTELKTTANGDWKTITCQLTAPAVDKANGVRFGFERKGTGKVYLDNLVLTQVGSASPVPEKDNLVANGSTLNGWTGATEIHCFAAPDGGLGVGAKGVEISTTLKEEESLEAGCEYVLQFRADVTNAQALLVTVGNAKLIPKEGIAMESGWKDFTCTFTPTEVENQSITISGEGNEISLDDVCLYRKYPLGDANGDGVVNCKDLVRYKKGLAGEKLATYVFSDFDGTRDGIGFDRNGVVVDQKDIKACRKYLAMRQCEVGPDDKEIISVPKAFWEWLDTCKK